VDGQSRKIREGIQASACEFDSKFCGREMPVPGKRARRGRAAILRRHSGTRVSAGPESIWPRRRRRNGFRARRFASPRNDGWRKSDSRRQALVLVRIGRDDLTVANDRGCCFLLFQRRICFRRGTAAPCAGVEAAICRVVSIRGHARGSSACVALEEKCGSDAGIRPRSLCEVVHIRISQFGLRVSEPIERDLIGLFRQDGMVRCSGELAFS
jgi:hypothetical protein